MSPSPSLHRVIRLHSMTDSCNDQLNLGQCPVGSEPSGSEARSGEDAGGENETGDQSDSPAPMCGGPTSHPPDRAPGRFRLGLTTPQRNSDEDVNSGAPGNTALL